MRIEKNLVIYKIIQIEGKDNKSQVTEIIKPIPLIFALG